LTHGQYVLDNAVLDEREGPWRRREVVILTDGQTVGRFFVVEPVKANHEGVSVENFHDDTTGPGSLVRGIGQQPTRAVMGQDLSLRKTVGDLSDFLKHRGSKNLVATNWH